MKRIVHFVVIAMLAACGGGGGGDSGGGNVTPPPPPPPEDPSGFWVGEITGDGITNDLSCLTASTFETICIAIDPTTGVFLAASTGTVSVTNGNQVSGSGTSYAALGVVFADGSTVASFTITAGTVSERSSSSLTVDSAGTTSSSSGTFDAEYDRDSSLAKVAGVYMNFFIGGTVSSFSIDADGVIFAQTATNCVGNGQVSVIDSQFNEYDVQLTVSSCPGLNGTYNGLGLTTDTFTMDDTFVFVISTSTSAIIAAAVK